MGEVPCTVRAGVVGGGCFPLASLVRGYSYRVVMTDFDFLVGSWNVTNRRLVKVLAGCAEWDEFPGFSRSWSALGGAANLDEIVFPTKGWAGLTTRLRDAETGRWSLYWASSRSGRFDVPVVGEFVDGVGLFYADEEHEGRPIRSRFTWSDITSSSARWAQAFSPDGGQTWETNWIMDFIRADD